MLGLFEARRDGGKRQESTLLAGYRRMPESSQVSRAGLLVTGAKGFVGRHFCRQYGGVSLEDEEGTVDLCDAARVRSAVAASMPERVLHLAAQSSVAASIKDPELTFAVNFMGTFNLLRALKASQFRGVFLYVGSADVYGQTGEADLPIRESQALRPRSPYAVSKVAAEALCYQWSQTEDFRIVMARPFTQIGPRQDRRFAVSDFAHQIAEIRCGKRSPFLVTGDLEVIRDISDVRDTICAYQMLLEDGKNGEVYNICSGQGRTLRSIVEELLRLAGVQAGLQTDASRLRATEQRKVIGDRRKINEQLGWFPQIPITTTLMDILRAAAEENR